LIKQERLKVERLKKERMKDIALSTVYRIEKFLKAVESYASILDYLKYVS